MNSNAGRGRPRRLSCSPSPPQHLCCHCKQLESEKATLEETLKEMRRVSKCEKMKLRRLRKKMDSMQQPGYVPPASARTTAMKQTETAAMAQLIEMRAEANKITAAHKLWVDEKTHANPGSHVGDWGAQTVADLRMFKVNPDGYKPMAGGSVYTTRQEVDAAKVL